MNCKDMKIITHLRKDARMPITKMSKKTQIPVSTIFDRIKTYENNIIVRHTTLLDFQKLGYSTRANIQLKVDKDDRENIKTYLVNNCFVNTVYKINNGFDFMLEGIFKDLQNMDLFMEQLEDRFRILDHKAFFIIEDIKRECFMADPLLSINPTSS